MGTMELLSRLIKFSLSCIKKLNKTAKLILIAGLAIMLRYYFRTTSPVIQKIPFSEFISPLNLMSLDWVKIYPNFIIGADKFKNLIKVGRTGVPASSIMASLGSTTAAFAFPMRPVNGSLNYPSDLHLFLISLVISVIISYFIFSENDKKKPSKPADGVKFSDIVGLNSAKKSLQQVIEFMVNPEKYQKMGARMRKGVLLYGPPGTGKTTLAKACANEAGVPFYSCNAAEFCQIYVGMGPKKVRNLFQKAKKNAPSVIFIDELDAFGSRGSQLSFMENGNSQKNSTINQMLSELDGFQSSERVLVIGATNRLQMVDKSLTRAGRFDLKIHTGLPTLQERIQIFKRYLRNKKNNIQDDFLRKILSKWDNPSGADIEALLNESVYQSMRRNGQIVEQEDINAAYDSVILNRNGKRL